jgi:regulatory protein
MEKTITALTAQQRNRERVNVFLDGEFAFGLARIVAAWLQVGQKLSEEKIASLLSEDQREVAYQRALRFVQFRERSEAEIQENLREHKVPEEIIQEVLERLQRSGIVDNRRFARTWIENRSEFRPRSRRALAYELRRRGIEQEVIQDSLESLDDEELAYQAAIKQTRKYRELPWQEYRQKMYAFLARRGFSYETAAPVVARIWAEHRADESLDEESLDDYG